jgi:hypothetical protein
MKTKSSTVQLSTGIAVAVLACGIANLHAASAPVAQPLNEATVQAPQFETVAWETVRIEKLQHAYYLLEHANSEYNGHKVEAMHSIKKAAETLGVELHGHSHWDGEEQWNSDRRLNEARNILENLAEKDGPEQPHIHRAIKELDKALATK